VHTSAKARLTSVGEMDPYRDSYSDPRSGSPPKFNHLITGQLPTFAENLMKIRSEVFAQSC